MPGCELKSFVVVGISQRLVSSFCKIIFVIATLKRDIDRVLVESESTWMRVDRVLGCELKSFVVVDISQRLVSSFCNIIFVMSYFRERHRDS